MGHPQQWLPTLLMAKKPVVKIFDPKKDITLTTDAREHSISGILLQKRHPIMNIEFNNSNIEKEALAIVWTTTRAQQFLIGK